MRAILLLFAVFAIAIPCAAQGNACVAAPATLTAPELASQLVELEKQLGSASRGRDFYIIAECLPSDWKVKEQGSEIVVSTERIKEEILETGGAITPDKRQEKLAALQGRLCLLRERLSAYSNKPYQQERTKINEILARSEFGRLSDPGLLARIRDWINQQQRRFAAALLRHLPGTTPFFKIAGWALVLLAFALVMRALLKLLWDDHAQVKLEDRAAISATHWSDWLAQARAAAERSDWRDAIRYTYWGAVSHLEQQGCWTPDRARTPREYLRLLKESGDRRTLLTDLTRGFERAWYAQHPATEGDYRKALSAIEALGCR